jgi:peroxiredoxin
MRHGGDLTIPDRPVFEHSYGTSCREIVALPPTTFFRDISMNALYALTKKLFLAALPLAVFLTPLSAHCATEQGAGATAPEFTAKDSSGADVSLKDLKGKIVVLEWFNPNCPFVKKFYSNGDMQRFQKDAAAKGAVWLTISSSAAGKNGHLEQDTAAKVREELSMQSKAILLDKDGSIGKAYGARTTPHLFVVDAAGKIAYSGAVDNVPSTDSSDIAGATNYVALAIDALVAGKPVEVASTEPYGCSVKY